VVAGGVMVRTIALVVSDEDGGGGRPWWWTVAGEDRSGCRWLTEQTTEKTEKHCWFEREKT